MINGTFLWSSFPSTNWYFWYTFNILWYNFYILFINVNYDIFLRSSLPRPINSCVSTPFYMIIVVDKWHKWRGCRRRTDGVRQKGSTRRDAQSDRYYLPSKILFKVWFQFFVDNKVFCSFFLPSSLQKNLQIILFLSHQVELELETSPEQELENINDKLVSQALKLSSCCVWLLFHRLHSKKTFIRCANCKTAV